MGDYREKGGGEQEGDDQGPPAGRHCRLGRDHVSGGQYWEGIGRDKHLECREGAGRDSHYELGERFGRDMVERIPSPKKMT